MSAAISPAGTSQLELKTLVQIQSNGGSITVSKLGLTAGGVIGAVANTLKTSVSNLEAFTLLGGDEHFTQLGKFVFRKRRLAHQFRHQRYQPLPSKAIQQIPNLSSRHIVFCDNR